MAEQPRKRLRYECEVADTIASDPSVLKGRLAQETDVLKQLQLRRAEVEEEIDGMKERYEALVVEARRLDVSIEVCKWFQSALQQFLGAFCSDRT